MFSRVSVCPRAGVPGQVPPGRYTPRAGTPPGQVQPPGRYTPRAGIPPLGMYPPAGTPLGRYNPRAGTPHGAVHAGRYGQQAGLTHPIGMHYCPF